MKEIKFEETKDWKLYLVNDEEADKELKENCISLSKVIRLDSAIVVLGSYTFFCCFANELQDMKKLEENVLNAVNTFKSNPPDFSSAYLNDCEGNIACGIVQLNGGIFALTSSASVNPEKDSPDAIESLIARQIAMDETENPSIKGYFVPEGISL